MTDSRRCECGGLARNAVHLVCSLISAEAWRPGVTEDELPLLVHQWHCPACRKKEFETVQAKKIFKL